MKALWTCPLIVCLLAARLAGELGRQSDKVAEDKPVKTGRGKFTISKETTYVTEPVDKDGYIDYARALNRRLRQGVTPENNANVLIWKAIGPHPEGATMPTEFFQWLGMPPPPEKGEYFIDLKDYLKIDRRGERADELNERLDRLLQRPLIAKENEDIASWLQANEKALVLVVAATKRSHYYSPLVRRQGKEGPSGLIGAPLSGVQECRGLASALTARAMLRLQQGKYDEAWQDLLACHRLGRLVGRGPTLIDALVGIAIDGLAGKADLAFLDRTKVDAKRMEICLRDLRQLPPLPEIADKVNLGERFIFLDAFMTVDRYGIKILEGLTAVGSTDTSDRLREFFADLVLLKGIDWDPALQNANHWFDRMTGAGRGKDRNSREKEWQHIEADVKTLKKKLDSGKLAEAILAAEDKAKAKGEVIGDIVICLLTPAIHKVQNACDRIKQEQNNRCLAFAVTWYHRDRGHYPKTLDALAPKYLAQIPQDIFSGKPLIYRPAENGFLLYSVGYNGKDDGGHDREDDPPGDDLVVRIPLPELSRK